MTTAHIHSVWFDMDGTLAKWNAEGKYNIPKDHYFRHCEPDNYLIPLFKQLYARYGNKLHIITSLCDKDGMEYQYEADKELWIRDVIPAFTADIQNQYHPILGQSKAGFAAFHLYANTRLTRQDILVTDSNHDLLPWDDAGGLAFKYANGINNPKSYNGPILTKNQTNLSAFLKRVCYEQTH